jgi:hypothetical protein
MESNYPKLIDLSDKNRYQTQMWIYEESGSTKGKLQYYGYDANLHLNYFSNFNSNYKLCLHLQKFTHTRHSIFKRNFIGG